jgi:hypothetical protein
MVGRKEIEMLNQLTEIFSKLAVSQPGNPGYTVIPKRLIPSSPVLPREARTTRSGEYRAVKRRQEFSLPTAVDQTAVVNVLLTIRETLLPSLADYDVLAVEELIDNIDQVLFAGLQDSDNWVLPKGLQAIPMVQNSLAEGTPLELVLEVMLRSLRTMIWLYPSDLGEFVSPLLDLEEAFAVVVGDATSEDDASNPQMSS